MGIEQQLAAADVEIEHHFVADEVYLKRTIIHRAGIDLTQHAHLYDHASALVKGAVRLCVEGTSCDITAPRMLLIEAGKRHSLITLTPTVWHCIHITSETDPAKVDAGLIA